jgi:hypothetical protein
VWRDPAQASRAMTVRSVRTVVRMISIAEGVLRRNNVHVSGRGTTLAAELTASFCSADPVTASRCAT